MARYKINPVPAPNPPITPPPAQPKRNDLTNEDIEKTMNTTIGCVMTSFLSNEEKNTLISKLRMIEQIALK